MELNHVISNIVTDYLQRISNTDLTYPFSLKPWEIIHKKEINDALVLSRISNTPLAVHLDFTPEKQEIILRGVLESNKPSTCAKLAKVDPSTLDKWLKMGERGISPYKQFYLEFNQAEALAQARDVRSLKEGGWKGAETLLKLRWGWQEALPEKGKFSEGHQTNININNETTVNIKPLTEMKEEERKLALFALLDEANGQVIDVD